MLDCTEKTSHKRYKIYVSIKIHHCYRDGITYTLLVLIMKSHDLSPSIINYYIGKVDVIWTLLNSDCACFG